MEAMCTEARWLTHPTGVQTEGRQVAESRKDARVKAADAPAPPEGLWLSSSPTFLPRARPGILGAWP